MYVICSGGCGTAFKLPLDSQAFSASRVSEFVTWYGWWRLSRCVGDGKVHLHCTSLVLVSVCISRLELGLRFASILVPTAASQGASLLRCHASMRIVLPEGD